MEKVLNLIMDICPQLRYPVHYEAFTGIYETILKFYIRDLDEEQVRIIECMVEANDFRDYKVEYRDNNILIIDLKL